MLQQKFRRLDFRRRAYFSKSNRLNILSLFTSMLRFTNHSMYILAAKYSILNLQNSKTRYFIKNISLLSRYNNIATKICFNNDTLGFKKEIFSGFLFKHIFYTEQMLKL